MKANRELKEFFNEMGDHVEISYFNIIHQGVRIDFVCRDENDEVHFYAGDPNSKYFDELIIDNPTARLYLEEILELL